MGKEIAAHYGKKPFVVLGLMNGAIFFMVDLLRRLPADWEVRCVTVASYAGTSSTGSLRGLENIGNEVKGRHVLLLDDILDTGLTLEKVREKLLEQGALKVDICVLLRKRKKRKAKINVRWVGFEVSDRYVLGYGFDFNGKYRGLHDIYALGPENIKKLNEQYKSAP